MKITVLIYGDADGEHNTYVKHNEQYLHFYTDGYERVSSKEIVKLLRFLGHDVFEVYGGFNRIKEIPKEKITDSLA